MLTRIYAVCFAKPNDLQDYIKMMEEAEKRDHRKLGQEMDLFHLDPEDPGQIFWHPNGWTVYTVMQDYMRKMIKRDGYQEVNTPAVMPRTLWERSGHWAHYQNLMFITESEKRMFARAASVLIKIFLFVWLNLVTMFAMNQAELCMV